MSSKKIKYSTLFIVSVIFLVSVYIILARTDKPSYSPPQKNNVKQELKQYPEQNNQAKLLMDLSDNVTDLYINKIILSLLTLGQVEVIDSFNDDPSTSHDTREKMKKFRDYADSCKRRLKMVPEGGRKVYHFGE